MAQHSYRHTCQGCGASWRSAKDRCRSCSACGGRKVKTAPLPWLPEGWEYGELDFSLAGTIIFHHFGEVEHSARWAQALLAETSANSEALERRITTRDRRGLRSMQGRLALE